MDNVASSENLEEMRPDIDRTDVVFADDGVGYSANSGIDKYWYPAMSRKDIEYVKRRAKYELNTTENYIDNLNKWLYNDKNSKVYFALYSTEDADNPTILYACNNNRAEREY